VLRVPDDARQQTAARLKEWVPAFAGTTVAVRTTGRPLVVVHPGCSMPARTYPWEMYAQVADRLIERLGASVILTGSRAERPLVERIQGAMRHTALACAGVVSFAEFCALIEAADVTITNNTGPMHIAAAVKTPVVALFALTNPPEQWGPWRVPHRQLYHEVPCRLCYSRACPTDHACLRLVSPEAVVTAAEELLESVSVMPRPGEASGLRALAVQTPRSWE
jgi:ADP-heptose:LPS heptosyltransferase